jgi:aldose 1-epimerase
MSSQFTGSASPTDQSSRMLVAGDYQAAFLPAQGMLGASLRYRGIEVLRHVEELELAAVKGSTAGIPLLYPWANRLDRFNYSAAGLSVELNPASRLLHFDQNALPIHGVPWARLEWKVTRAKDSILVAHLDWDTPELLAIFPFRHRVVMHVTLDDTGLTIETTVIAGSEAPAPISFGFHPYIGLPLPREQWQLTMPSMRRLVLDCHQIPTGNEETFGGFDAALGGHDFDDGYALATDQAMFTIAGAGCQINVEFIAGYRFVQVYAPKDQSFISVEPMTAPTNALVSGKGLQVIPPNGRYRAAFRIAVTSSQ